jgi:hypothetical protein
MDKAKLLKARTGKVTSVPVDGGEVKVRPLTRAEAHALRGREYTEEEAERKVLALAMVQPSLTEEEVGEWQAVAPAGELDEVLDVVLEISGMAKNAAKSGLQEAGD